MLKKLFVILKYWWSNPKKVSVKIPPKKPIKESKNEVLKAIIACALLLIGIMIIPIVNASIVTAGIVIFGTGVVDKYGTTGFSVFSHNFYGTYERCYKIPKNPISVPQSVQRQLITIFSRAWSALSTSGQDSFTNFAKNHPYMKKGRLIHMTGEAQFVQMSINAQLISSAEVNLTSAPLEPFIFPIVSGCSIVTATAPDSFTVEPVKIGIYNTGTKVLIYCSAPVGLGIRSPKSVSYKLIAAIDPTGTPEMDITSSYEEIFGLMSEYTGLQVFGYIRLVAPTGEYTEIVRFQSLIQPSV